MHTVSEIANVNQSSFHYAARAYQPILSLRRLAEPAPPSNKYLRT